MFPPQKPTSVVEFDAVSKRIQAIVDDEHQRKELLEAKDDVAQEWLDLFQLVVEYPNIPRTLRTAIFKLMIRLSRKSGLHPQCLVIKGVEKLGDYPVGGGAFGDVWKGKIGQQLVCLKVIRAFNRSDVQLILKDYMQEGILWCQLNHPNVLPFMGIYYLDTQQRQLCLVSPWMERGNLVELLRTSKDLVDHDLLAYDVACGLSYLHSTDIVHGDLKGVNILVTPDLRACIADFGLARVSNTQLLLSETSRSKGTTRWLSPELLKPGCVPSRESDVYAYACVCYEIFVGKVPFYEVAEAAIVFAVLIDRKHPSRPEDCVKLRDSMWDMMMACWNEAPSSRPIMTDVLTRIHEMNVDRRLEPASNWNDPTFTRIWNDADRPPVSHTGESDQSRNGPSDLVEEGFLRVEEGNYDRAIHCFQRSLQQDNANGEAWRGIGHCFLVKDNWQQSYYAYQQALYYLSNPREHPKVWYDIGILYDRYGTPGHAEEAFLLVLRTDKDFEKANDIHFRLGTIYKQQSKYEEALQCFDRVLRNPPTPLTDADIWFQIGHVYELQKELTQAKQAYERALASNPTHAKVLQQLGWLYHQDETPFQSHDIALRYVTKSLEADPSEAQSWYLLGRVYMVSQNYNAAYEAYQQAVYRDGRNPDFWCSIGVLYFKANQFRDALDAYSRAIRINPYIPEVWFDLGSLYESCNNQISDAIDAYVRASELDPNNTMISGRLRLLKQAQATGVQIPPAPRPQDVHPKAYASSVVPSSGLSALPSLLQSSGQREVPGRADSRRPPGAVGSGDLSNDIRPDMSVDPKIEHNVMQLINPEATQSTEITSNPSHSPSVPPARRPSVISIPSLHRPALPPKLDLPSTVLRASGEEAALISSELHSPVTLTPRSARPTDYTDLMAAFAPTADPKIDIDLTLPDTDPSEILTWM